MEWHRHLFPKKLGDDSKYLIGTTGILLIFKIFRWFGIYISGIPHQFDCGLENRNFVLDPNFAPSVPRSKKNNLNHTQHENSGWFFTSDQSNFQADFDAIFTISQAQWLKLHLDLEPWSKKRKECELNQKYQMKRRRKKRKKKQHEEYEIC